jgi:arylsulfatase A-like enzyme
MTRRLTAVLVAALTLMAAGAARAQTPARPNVVLIVTDDVGYGDIGSYGAPDLKTPNLDRLAREGVRFTDFYAAPTCSPTRAALLSGRYYQRVRIDRPLPSAGQAVGRGLRPTGRTLPALLKAGGYATGLIGKWHLGYEPEFSPRAHGFDSFFGFKSGLIDYYQHTDTEGQHDLFDGDTPVHPAGYSTDLFTDRAVKFIDEHASRPFFLEVAYNAAHWPFQVPDHPSVAPNNARFVQPVDDATSTRADYVAILERADQGIGRILAALSARGLDRNTLVVFMNDNGGEWLSRNAPLFHRKDSLWEGGVRVPAIMRWPGRIPAGRVSSQVGIVMDVTATLVAAAGVTVPAEAKLEGINLLPVIEGRQAPVERTLYFRNTTGGRQQRAVRKGNWKLLVDGPNTFLFDLSKDIGERNDLASSRQAIARELRPLLAAWEKDVDDEATATMGPPVGALPGARQGGAPPGRPGGPGQ